MGDEIRLRVKYSDIKVLDVEITGGIEQIEENLSSQLSALEDVGGTIPCENAKVIVETAQKQVGIVKQNLDLLEKGDLKTFDEKQNKLDEAKQYEPQGFEALQKNDRNDDTISHNEIKQIVEKYSWGMPKDTRNNLEKKLKS